jgi:hypothetical protein
MKSLATHLVLNNMKPTTQPKPKKTSIKKGEIRNPKGRGAEKFATKLSFSEVLNKAMNVKG